MIQGTLSEFASLFCHCSVPINVLPLKSVTEKLLGDVLYVFDVTVRFEEDLFYQSKLH